MIDLIIVSKRYNLEDYNSNFLNQILEKERPIYYKKYFTEIIKIFVEEFKLNNDIEIELTDLGNLRNTLGHAKPSLGNYNIIIIPSSKSLTDFLKNRYTKFNGSEPPSNSYSIKMGDQDVYEYYFKEIEKFDYFFQKLASNFKISYNWIQ